MTTDGCFYGTLTRGGNTTRLFVPPFVTQSYWSHPHMSSAGKWADTQVFILVILRRLMANLWLIPSQIQKNEKFLVWHGCPTCPSLFTVPPAAVDIFAACTTRFDCLGRWRCCLNLHLSDLKLRHLRAITDLIRWLFSAFSYLIWHLFAFALFFYFPADCHADSHPFNWRDHIQSMLSGEMDRGGLTWLQTCVCFVYKMYPLFYHLITYHILSSLIMHLIICPWDSGRKKKSLNGNIC